MSRGSILAIDDEQNIRHLIESEFSMEGLAVTTAGSGEEGLKLFDTEEFDVVLLDLLMPKMDGFQVLERMKADSTLQHIPVIVTSAAARRYLIPGTTLRCLSANPEPCAMGHRLETGTYLRALIGCTSNSSGGTRIGIDNLLVSCRPLPFMASSRSRMPAGRP